MYHLNSPAGLNSRPQCARRNQGAQPSRCRGGDGGGCGGARDDGEQQLRR